MLKVKRGELVASCVTYTRRLSVDAVFVFWGMIFSSSGWIFSAVSDGSAGKKKNSQNGRWFTSVDRRRTDAQEIRPEPTKGGQPSVYM